MVQFDFQQECYSCSACSSVCPTGSISFNETLHPVINKEKCINCGKCNNVCIRKVGKPYQPILPKDSKGFVCRNRNDSVREKSSSGGCFYALAQTIIDLHGVVCGCVYDDTFMPRHIVTDNITDVERMMGSKYVKSDMANCLSELREYSKKQIPILFTGVPCQVAAAKRIIKDYENVFFVSVVCHGSIERNVWTSYLQNERNCGEIVYVTMRDKSRDWLDYGLRFRFADGSEHITYRRSNGYFLKCFTDGLLERDRCLNCEYKGTNQYADIMLGDGWGMAERFPDLVDRLGVSSVICLNERGRKLLHLCSEKLMMHPIEVEEIIRTNQRIISPALENPKRKQFMQQYEMAPEKIQALCEKYATSNRSLVAKMHNVIRKLIRKK